MESQSSATPPPAEVPLTPEKKKLLDDRGSPYEGTEKSTWKGDLSPEKKEFFERKMSIERKLVTGGYEFLSEMATNINGGVPSKDIEQIVFKNMMRIMLREFNA